MVKQSDVLSGSAYMHMFSSTRQSMSFGGAFDPVTIFLIVFGLFFVGIFLFLCFLPREVPLAFVVKLA